MGLPEPQHASMPNLRSVTNGMKHWRKMAGILNPKNTLPLTLPILHGLTIQWGTNASEYINIMSWAVACTAYFGFFRLGGLLLCIEGLYNPALHLSFGDVKVDNTTNPALIQIIVKQSKTDQGTMVYVGKTGNDLCPVIALLAYMAARGPQPGPFFINPDGSPFQKQPFIKRVREGIAAMGINPASYTGHSFRIGTVTMAAQLGIEDSTIHMLGCWHCDAFRVYIQTPRQQSAAYSTTLSTILNVQ